MRPIPIPSFRSSRAAAALALATLAACGRSDPPATLRVSPDAPLAASGREERPLPPAEAAPPLSTGGGLATFVASLPAPAVVAPRPALADPAEQRRAADPRAFTPRLTGRSPDGKDVVELPLAHTRVVAQVSGNVARVEVTQFYVNPSKDRLEVVYAFPLPPNAAVTDMLFRIGNRVVLSEVHRREEAKRTYEAAKREGRTAALTEQERPNLFTQSVANVPPGDTVAVVLRYVHEVPFDDGRYLFHFPTTIGPRYIPGAPAQGAGGPGWSPDTDRVPDASRVTPPVVPEGQRSAHDVDILVRLVPAEAFDDVVAKSHRVVTGVDGDGARLVALAEDDRVPNKDLVLSWRPAAAAPAAHALVQRERGEDWLLLFLQPPAEVAPSMVRPKELVFLVDKSGSMMGAPIERVKALVARALDALLPDDTFQIVAFDGATQSMTPAPVPGTAENVARAKAWLRGLSGGGGTEMLQGIRAVLEAPSDPRRVRMVVFCTDGFIGNEPEVIEAVSALRGSARVFGFGIGTSVNRYLIEGVGRAGQGAAEVLDLKEPPDEAVARLFRRIDRPVLTDLALAFEGAQVTDLLPAKLPDLFAGQPLVVAGRVRGGAPSRVVLRGRLGERPWEARVPVAAAHRPAAVSTGSGQAPSTGSGSAPAAGAPQAPAGTEQPVTGTLWARRRIEELASARPTSPPPAAVEEIVAHALRFKLVTAYTSFVAVERELRVDPTLPLAQAVVPNEMPDGVEREGIFGPATSVRVLPARVKPGDPELRVVAGPDAVAVRVALPFEARAREAVRDERRGDFVLRFLVPSGWPDGSWDARVTIVRAGGDEEVRTVPIRVDTTPAAIAVLSAPRSVRAGEEVRIALKPALPVARLVDFAGRPGGLANAVKGAMEVKEVLVRAPWGEVVRARMEGPLGVWVATLRAPADAAEGAAELEVAASDAAGNVARRTVPLAVRAGPAVGEDGRVAYAGMAGAAAFATVLLGALVAAVLLRGRHAPPPLERVLRAGAPKRAGER
jgi:Ca-activated chloride channel family protein